MRSLFFRVLVIFFCFQCLVVAFDIANNLSVETSSRSITLTDTLNFFKNFPNYYGDVVDYINERTDNFLADYDENESPLYGFNLISRIWNFFVITCSVICYVFGFIYATIRYLFYFLLFFLQPY